MSFVPSPKLNVKYLEYIEIEDLEECQIILDPILKAVKEKQYTMVSDLLKKIPPVKHRGWSYGKFWKDGQAAASLMLACQDPEFSLEIIELLIERGCPSDCDIHGKSHDRWYTYNHTFTTCVENDNINALRLLIACGRRSYDDISDALTYAIRLGKTDVVFYLLDLDVSQAFGPDPGEPNNKIHYRMAPMTRKFSPANAHSVAMKEGHVELARKLKERFLTMS